MAFYYKNNLCLVKRVQIAVVTIVQTCDVCAALPHQAILLQVLAALLIQAWEELSRWDLPFAMYF